MSRPEETIDPAEAGCRLFLISPPRLDPVRFTAALEAALGGGRPAAFLLRLEDATAADRERIAGALQPVCARHQVAFLLQDDVTLARTLGADGVHLGDGAAVASARAALGAERILGVSCGGSREAAMVAGEAGADYIAFGDPERPPDASVLELIRWWSELFVLPSLAEAASDPGDCAELARAGADFIAVSAAVWQHPEGPAAGLGALEQAIEAA